MSFFQNTTNQKKIRDNSLSDYITLVRNGGSFLNSVTEARSEFEINGKTERYKALKKRLPAVTSSCTTSAEGRAAKDIEKANGLIVLDIDFDSKEGFNDEIYETVKNDEYTLLTHKSVSGVGFCVFVKINSNRFLESFKGLEKYYSENFGLEVDASCKNVNRLRYMSFDKKIHVNQTSKAFKEYLKEKKPSKKEPSILYTSDELGLFIQRVIDNGQPLAGDTYEGWVSIAHAIASVEPNLIGASYFHALSKLSIQYNEKQAQIKWNQCQGSGGVGIGTLYHYAAEVGVKQRYSENMSQIIKLTSNHKKQAGNKASKEGAAAYIQTIDSSVNIDTEIIEKILSSDKDFSKGLSSDSEIQQLQEYIFENYKPRLNVFTEVTELNGGKPLNDRLRNTVVLDCKNVLNFKVQDSDVDKILYSNDVPDFDPIDTFIRENEEAASCSEIDKLIECLTLNEQSDEFKALFLKKWLVSWFAYKTFEGYSPLTLVLTGGQNLGKTWFFRNLLPKTLQEEGLYSENQLTGKLEDIFSIMSKSLIIVNDEFSVSSKKSSEAFKELVSKKDLTYRKPYAREVLHKKRISVFAGTTNNKEILVDNTGNRRIIVFDLKSIDHELYNSIDKDLLFMEVFNLWKNDKQGFRLSFEDVRLLNGQSKEMEVVTSEEEALSSKFQQCDHKDGLQMNEILAVLNTDGSFIQYSRGRLKGALLKLGYTQARIEGKRPYNIRKVW